MVATVTLQRIAVQHAKRRGERLVQYAFQSECASQGAQTGHEAFDNREALLRLPHHIGRGRPPPRGAPVANRPAVRAPFRSNRSGRDGSSPRSGGSRSPGRRARRGQRPTRGLPRAPAPCRRPPTDPSVPRDHKMHSWYCFAGQRALSCIHVHLTGAAMKLASKLFILPGEPRRRPSGRDEAR